MLRRSTEVVTVWRCRVVARRLYDGPVQMLQSFSELQLVGLERPVISRCAVDLHHWGVAVSDPPGRASLSRLTQHAFVDGLVCYAAVSSAIGHGVGLCPTCVADGWLMEPTL